MIEKLPMLPGRPELTPADLQEAGWVMQPHFNTGQWKAYRVGVGNGLVFSPVFPAVEQVVDWVRCVYIERKPYPRTAV